MKSEMSYMMMGVVSAAAILMCITSTEAVKCYDCYTAANFNNDCKPVSNKTKVSDCSTSCQIVTSVGGYVNRGCGEGTQNNVTSCTGWKDLKACTYTCTSDLCNGGVVNSAKTASIFAVLTAAILAAITANGQKLFA